MKPSPQAITIGSLLVVAACGGDDAPPVDDGPNPPAACVRGERRLDDGRCEPAGLPLDLACAPGSLLLEDECVPAGLPAERCAPGSIEAGGCIPVLPDEKCASGSMALPGEMGCREVAPCGNAPWGEIPREANTQHVSRDFDGVSDGSAAAPWKTIQEGIDHADAGAIVAVAAGTYPGDVRIEGKPVRLWGHCPASTTIEATGNVAAVVIGSGADGAEVHDLAATSDIVGVGISGSQDVVLDRVWIHDTGAYGIVAEDYLGPTSATLARSLVERADSIAVSVAAAAFTLDSTVLRDPRLGGSIGRGIELSDPASKLAMRDSMIEGHPEVGVLVRGAHATFDGVLIRDGGGEAVAALPKAGTRPSIELRGSILERNAYAGLLLSGGDGVVQGSIVRDTSADDLGAGLSAENDPDSGARASVVIVGSIFDRNSLFGAVAIESDLRIETSIVRATNPGAQEGSGRGLQVQSGAQRGRLDVVSSIVEQNYATGVAVIGADAIIASSIVRDTQPDPSAPWGLGVLLQDARLGRAAVNIEHSRVERSRSVAVLVEGCDILVVDSVISDTQPSSDGIHGRGLGVQNDLVTLGRGGATLQNSVVEKSYGHGVVVGASDLWITASEIRETRARTDGRFGDALVLVPSPAGSPSARLDGAVVADSARAGIANFGGAVAFGASRFECNAFDLQGETMEGVAASFEPFGAVQCGCPTAAEECQVSSGAVDPPDELLAP